MSKLADILETFCDKLPSLTTESDYFPTKLFNHLDDYFNSINSPDFILESEYINSEVEDNFDTFGEQVKKINDGIKKALSYYLNGLPSKSYEVFKATINTTYLKYSLQLSQVKKIKRGQNFYRIRSGGLIAPITPQELFHIPFEKRKFIATQRFSIPGYPCLYLGNSLSVSCKEVKIYSFDDLTKAKIARLSNNCNLLIVDIDPFELRGLENGGIFGNKAKSKIYVYWYGLLYPLIAACHFRVSYSKDPSFKIEYIIPQLLLQWFRDTNENKLINGIRYLSSRIDSKDDHTKMYNYVFPAVDCEKEKGHCSNLKHLFKISEVIDVSSFRFKATTFTEMVEELEKALNEKTMSTL